MIRLKSYLAQGHNPIGILQPQLSSGYVPSGNAASDMTKLISNILGILTIISGISFLFYFLIGAVNWITSGGDSSKAQAAKSIILNAVIGLAITAIAYPVAQLISTLLGIPLAKPEDLFNQFQ